MHETKTEDVYEDFSNNKEMYGFSNYWAKKKYFDDSKKLVVVKMKDKETGVLLLNNFLD